MTSKGTTSVLKMSSDTCDVCVGEWMETVPEPEPLELGAEVKGKK